VDIGMLKTYRDNRGRGTECSVLGHDAVGNELQRKEGCGARATAKRMFHPAGESATAPLKIPHAASRRHESATLARDR
jgi:hypothetical protein